MKNILFVCKGNSGSSLMAECFFNKYSKEDKAISSGWKHSEEGHTNTIKLMKEVDIDVSKYEPRPLIEKEMEEADKIIAMNSAEKEHVSLKYKKKIENWNIPILSDKTFRETRKIRNDIEKSVKSFIARI